MHGWTALSERGSVRGQLALSRKLRIKGNGRRQGLIPWAKTCKDVGKRLGLRWFERLRQRPKQTVAENVVMTTKDKESMKGEIMKTKLVLHVYAQRQDN